MEHPINSRCSIGPVGSDHLPAFDDAVRYTAGERLEMPDGSIWFHPYDGTRPTCLRPANTQAEL